MIGSLAGSPRYAAAAAAAAALLLHVPGAVAQDVFVAEPGQNITTWSTWTMSGTLYLKIESAESPACMQVWWNRMGIVTDPWEVCDRAEVSADLPLIFGKLRAGHFRLRTAISLYEEAGVAYSQELCGRVIAC